MVDLEKSQVRDALTEVYDPELHVDIISLGLIYDVDIDESGDVDITMTLTFPGCPYGPQLVDDVTAAVEELENAGEVEVDITFEPRWTPDKIDDDIRAAIGM